MQLYENQRLIDPIFVSKFAFNNCEIDHPFATSVKQQINFEDTDENGQNLDWVWEALQLEHFIPRKKTKHIEFCYFMMGKYLRGRLIWAN